MKTIPFLLFIVAIVAPLQSLRAQKNSRIITYTKSIDISKKGKAETTFYEVEIGTKDHGYLGDIEIVYQKGDRIDIHEAVIIDSNNRVVRKMKKKDITTSSYSRNGVFFGDLFVKSFSLKWNSYPYRIRYSYTRHKSKYIGIADWIPIVDRRMFTEKAVLTVKIPKEMKVKLLADTAFCHTKRDTLEHIIHKWEIKYATLPNAEYYAPHYSENAPRVVVQPCEFNYFTDGLAKDWATFGDWATRLNEGLDKLPDHEYTETFQMVQSAKDTLEVVRRLYHYLQDNTRYVNVSLKFGGMRSFPASYVSQKKYGDCKALTTFMKALLKAHGIKSYYTLVNSGDYLRRIDPNIVSNNLTMLFWLYRLKMILFGWKTPVI